VNGCKLIWASPAGLKHADQFCDQGMTNLGRMYNDSYRYYVQTSDDGKIWQICLNRSDNLRDSPMITPNLMSR